MLNILCLSCMGMTSSIVIKEDLKDFRSNTNFKVRQRIQSLIQLKGEKFKRQADLAAFIGIDHSSLKRWIKQYKTSGYASLVTLKSSGNYKGVISESLHKALESKINDSQDPLLGYWHTVA